jgi:hypothetical protein
VVFGNAEPIAVLKRCSSICRMLKTGSGGDSQTELFLHIDVRSTGTASFLNVFEVIFNLQLKADVSVNF